MGMSCDPYYYNFRENGGGCSSCHPPPNGYFNQQYWPFICDPQTNPACDPVPHDIWPPMHSPYYYPSCQSGPISVKSPYYHSLTIPPNMPNTYYR
ncbi:hypothetical protein P4J12_36015 [Bacillus cereus]|nr:hypothetical protein [Bacillus cereus]